MCKTSGGVARVGRVGRTADPREWDVWVRYAPVLGGARTRSGGWHSIWAEVWGTGNVPDDTPQGYDLP